MKPAGETNFIRAEAELLLLEARKQKAERIKNHGEPIELSGKALAIEVVGPHAWIAENTALVRKVELETGKTAQLYRGHTAPVTCLAFIESPGGNLLVTGSWDKSIRIWDTKTKSEISRTENAHGDFVKTLLVIPTLKLLVSGGSDKIVRFWDIGNVENGKPLRSAGSTSSHTRPVACLAAGPIEDQVATLFTADTMGVISAWKVELETGPSPRWKASNVAQLNAHRTGVSEMFYGNGFVWTASLDENVFVQPFPPARAGTRAPPPLAHPVAVRCLLPLAITDLGEPYVLTGAGDIIRAFDLSTPDEPEALGMLDAHWHDVTALRLWLRKVPGSDDNVTRAEPWIVSASLDGTLRKWKLLDLLHPPKPDAVVEKALPKAEARKKDELTEEEERELAELMGDDE